MRNVLSPAGTPYSAYEGEAYPYKMLYSIAVAGEVSSDTATLMVDFLIPVWTNAIANIMGRNAVPVMMKVLKVEQAFGDFG